MPASAGSVIKTQVKKIDGLSIRYAESEPRDVSAILLSPWPESLYTFEQMWSRLAEHAHLVAIDLPGFGHSQRRDELLKSSTMGEFVAHAVEAFELTRPHAVGPDIGTSTLLFTAANHPGLLRSVTVGNGTAAVPIQIGSVLKDAVDAPNLDALRQIDPHQGVDSVLAFVEHYKLPEHVHQDFLESYEGDRFAESIRFVRSYKDELPVLRRPSAAHPDARPDHHRGPRPRRPAGERRVPARAPPAQQARPPRRRALRLGGRRRRLRPPAHRLVDRRLRAGLSHAKREEGGWPWTDQSWFSFSCLSSSRSSWPSG